MAVPAAGGIIALLFLLKNVALLGGTRLLADVGAGPVSVDARAAARGLTRAP